MNAFELYYPVKPYGLNQGFGADGAYYQAHGINIIGHNGLDLRATHGQPVYASHDGIAYFETDDSAGEGVVLITNTPFDYKTGQAFYKSIYWHLADYSKEPQYKSPVLDYQQKNGGRPMPTKRGDLIGYADNTGLSTGDHCHWGLKVIQPGTPIGGGQDATDVGIGNWTTLNYTNGYLGAIDPTPYCNGKFAQDTDQIVQADQMVDTIDDLKKVETPQNISLIDQIIDGLWKAFLVIFDPNK